MRKKLDDAKVPDDRLTTSPFSGADRLPRGAGDMAPRTTEPHPGDGSGPARPGSRSRGSGDRPRDPSASLDGSTVSPASSSGEAAPDGPPVPGQVWLDKYEVVRKLGRGAMGEVWLVRHGVLLVERALKLISLSAQSDPEMRARFRREARAMALFSHPNAVAVHDASTARDIAYIEMEYVVGRSLDKILEHGAPMPLDWTARILAQLCDVLQVAHESGIVHRDIKPSNLMLVDGQPSGRELLKVLDFGIAKILNEQNREADELKTRLGATIGTLAYMSPEQVGGEAEKVDGRSDLYAVGILLYELLTGNRPFTSPGFRLSYDHLYTTPPPFAASNPEVRVPPEVEQIVLRCLEKDPALRPQSARELADAFRRASAPPEPPPGPIPAPEARPPTRRYVLMAGLAAASGAGGLAAWMAFRPSTFKVSTSVAPSALQAGKEARVFIHIERGASSGRSQINAGPKPAGITNVERVTDEQSNDTAQFRVQTDLNAESTPMELALTFHVAVGRRSKTEVVGLSLQPPEVAPLPRDFVRTPGARLKQVGSKVYPDRISRTFPDGEEVDFLLVTKVRSSDPEPFYIMRDKVSIGLYRKFAEDRHGPTEADLAGSDDRLPMRGVTFQDAYDFAQWLGGSGRQANPPTAWPSDEPHLQANLPTTQQWDKAAGLYDQGGQDGPFMGPWKGEKGQIAVGREAKGPMPVGTATHDISWCGCRDMAGNGFEWTRNVAVSGELIPIPPMEILSIELRGQPYDSDEPLTFSDLERYYKALQLSDNREAGISFRVVLENL